MCVWVFTYPEKRRTVLAIQHIDLKYFSMGQIRRLKNLDTAFMKPWNAVSYKEKLLFCFQQYLKRGLSRLTDDCMGTK